MSSCPSRRSREVTLPRPSNTPRTIARAARECLKHIALVKKVRLIGVRLSGLVPLIADGVRSRAPLRPPRIDRRQSVHHHEGYPAPPNVHFRLHRKMLAAHGNRYRRLQRRAAAQHISAGLPSPATLRRVGRSGAPVTTASGRLRFLRSLLPGRSAAIDPRCNLPHRRASGRVFGRTAPWRRGLSARLARFGNDLLLLVQPALHFLPELGDQLARRRPRGERRGAGRDDAAIAGVGLPQHQSCHAESCGRADPWRRKNRGGAGLVSAPSPNFPLVE